MCVLCCDQTIISELRQQEPDLEIARYHPEHPNTLITVYNMGVLRFNSGDMAVAKALFVRCAKGWAESLGPTHPKTLQAQEDARDCD